MKIQYGFTDTIFGPVFLVFQDGKISRLSFSNQKSKELKSLKKDWPDLEHEEKSPKWIETQWKKLFSGQVRPSDLKKRVTELDRGTEFQKKVWRALLDIPFGKTTTYSEIAQKIGAPKAVRAVGTAVGANPMGYIIPCHRVLPKAGGLGGFAWGPEMKQRMLNHEN
jgi:AraC family transcriptional regulator of adaptative response/methylated-DNA-[protein]-cysteine methyltransferase